MAALALEAIMQEIEECDFFEAEENKFECWGCGLWQCYECKNKSEIPKDYCPALEAIKLPRL